MKHYIIRMGDTSYMIIGPMEDLAMRDMDAAAESVSYCRRIASEYRQMGFDALAEFHRDNAKAAEKWLVKAGRNYPERTGGQVATTKS